MYIERVPNRNSPPAVLVRESWREDGKVKKRTLANLSRLPDRVVDALALFLRGGSVIAEGLPGAFQITRSLPHGHVAAVLAAMRERRIANLVDRKASPERSRVLAMVAARILNPRSKLAMARGFREETAPDSLGRELGLGGNIDSEALYCAMDWLLERQEAIERKLARRHLEEGSLALWDVTSTWYEGRRCPLAARGHSRDKRRGSLQIVFGLLCDREGRPVAVEAFAGNTADPSTVGSQAEALRGRFGLDRVVLVGDRGMLTEARIREDLRPRGLEWISALRAPAIRKLVEDESLQPSLFDERDMARTACEKLYPGERLIVCRNPMLAEDRARKRLELLEATEAGLDEIAAATRRPKRALKGIAKIAERAARVLGKHKMRKHFVTEITETSFEWRRNEDRIAAETALDGFYAVRTNVPENRLDAAETVSAYKALASVERAFRTFKLIDLNVRPIHHRKEARVRAHLLLCMLSYYVEHHMRLRLRPMLFDDEAPPDRESVVAPAARSDAARRKARTGRTADGMPVHGFRSLLADLGTLCINEITPTQAAESKFEMVARPTPLQEKALKLLNAKITPAPR